VRAAAAEARTRDEHTAAAPSTTLLATLIPLVVLALIEMGVEMPADLLDEWFGSDGLRVSAAS
jgi:hypothetical protein